MRLATTLRLPLAALALLLTLSACDTNAPVAPPPAAAEEDPEYAALLADLGGLDGLSDFLASASNAEVEAAVARHGIAFEVIDLGQEAVLRRDITACVQYYPSSDRVKWFRLVGAGGPEDHYIDSRGRPANAFKSLGPIVTASRHSSCQTTVGNWGSPSSTYDGGHLVGSQLGGWGGRANLVPQHYNFNRGNWVKIENALAKCGRLGSGAVEFHVDVDYPNSTTLTPSQFHADVKIAGVWKGADFTNTTYGGSSGTSQANSMVSWLQGKGCY